MDPNEFENLIFDCARAAGLKNLVWRTPGADGGRDIEGISYSTDLSGFETVQRWYVECKRYTTSVDWPTVWQKIAYADVQDADVLLLATNSNPSPKCETEIENWNSSKRRPLIRVWRGYDLPRIIRSVPSIGAAYGLINELAVLQSSTVPLAMMVSNITQAAYAQVVFGSDNTLTLETAAALSELLTQSLNDLERYGRITGGALADKAPDYDWLTVTGDFGRWNDLGLRAVLTTLVYVRGATGLEIQFSGNVANVNAISQKHSTSSISQKIIDIISLWSLIEITLDIENPNIYRIFQR